LGYATAQLAGALYYALDLESPGEKRRVKAGWVQT
jgi:hypothetical protein